MHAMVPQLEEDFVKANPEWVKELQIMVNTKVKAEIQARLRAAWCICVVEPATLVLRAWRNDFTCNLGQFLAT